MTEVIGKEINYLWMERMRLLRLYRKDDICIGPSRVISIVSGMEKGILGRGRSMSKDV